MQVPVSLAEILERWILYYKHIYIYICIYYMHSNFVVMVSINMQRNESRQICKPFDPEMRQSCYVYESDYNNIYELYVVSYNISRLRQVLF